MTRSDRMINPAGGNSACIESVWPCQQDVVTRSEIANPPVQKSGSNYQISLWKWEAKQGNALLTSSSYRNEYANRSSWSQDFGAPSRQGNPISTFFFSLSFSISVFDSIFRGEQEKKYGNLEEAAASQILTEPPILYNYRRVIIGAE